MRRTRPLLLGLPVAVLFYLLWPVFRTFGRGLWGPDRPFLNGDFNGGWWLWWAWSEALRGRPRWGDVGWPEGVETVAGVIPNPVDMLVAGALGPPSALAWNLMQLGHLVALLLATGWLARRAGASYHSSAAATCLVAASPVLLHEVAGGRPSNLVVWPGLLALGFYISERPVRAGLAAAAQGVAYAWHGLALVLAGLPLIRNARRTAIALGVGVVAILPYLLWLSGGLDAVPADRPQVGYTAMPLAGLWGLDDVPSRFRLHPLLLGVALLGLRGGLKWLAGAALCLLIAIGPDVTWDLGEGIGHGPMAWLTWALPPLRRMHHPVRVMLFVLPMLAVALALGLDRLRGRVLLQIGLPLAAMFNGRAMLEATTYEQAQRPDFASLHIPGEGPVVDLLGMHHRTALAQQTEHGRAIFEPLSFRREDRPLGRELRIVAEGGPASPTLWAQLSEQGFEYVLVLDRFGTGQSALATVEAALGPPVEPHVYALP